ncbi:helix-turn-helix domain-containing protein [Pseudomonas sp. B33.4]|uniref:helix-turn-helix domain-containing protein n=1 Tax=Pseudomonas sp. B33.4 TaxID=3104265 RepID=UPI003A0FFDC2
MSYRTIDWVFNLQLPAQDKLILVYIAKCENEQEPCNASVKLLAAKCGVSARTVQRTLKKLCEAGLVSSTQRFRADGSQTVTSTLLTLSGLSQLCHPP